VRRRNEPFSFSQERKEGRKRKMNLYLPRKTLPPGLERKAANLPFYPRKKKKKKKGEKTCLRYSGDSTQRRAVRLQEEGKRWFDI